MRLLVLGGTHFVGRAVVEAALARGDDVTTVTRGVSGQPVPGTRPVLADRTVPHELGRALGDAEWDAVIDTWSGAPRVVSESSGLLADRACHYGYVSSRSVYRWPIPPGLDESAPVVDGDPGSPDGADYAAAKRGAELAVLDDFADRALLARAGLLLGPYEDVGRLPWWLSRVARGGRVLAPGPADRPLQYLDARDLAEWMLSAAGHGITGTFNAVSERGHATIGELLGACVEVVGGEPELVWTAPATLAAAGVSGWTDLPVWVPPTGELAGLHDCDVGAAMEAGLRCRPVRDTVRDTWDWLQREGVPATRADRPPVGLDPSLEQSILTAQR